MILKTIFSKNQQSLKLKKRELSYQELEKKAFSKKPKAIFDFLSKDQKQIQIIAELKKASPSKGVIREDFEPLNIALNYEKNGAKAISVLTEPHFFLGDLNYLKLLRAKINIPLLRKDFIFDEYQLLESVVFGADFVLLIAKMLSRQRLKALYDFAKELKLEVLFEIHDLEDLQKALFVGANIIGINHRNLEDFSMDMKLCQKLIEYIPKEKIIVAESGLEDRKILLELKSIGVDAFLIGEYFMRQNDEGLGLKKLIEGK